MRKFSVRFAILCILVLLIGVTALAVSGRVSEPKNEDANVVEVKLNPGNSGEAPTFSITRKNAEDGKLYTVLIRSGAENEKPSGGEDGNLVYMDMVEAQNGVVSVTKAYPKEMTAGTYRVFMSEYGTTNAIQQVATFNVDNSNPDDVRLGFVVDQSNNDITGNDVLYALYISVGKTVNGQEWTDVQRAAANVDGDDNVTGNDVLWILERSVGKRDANWNKVG